MWLQVTSLKYASEWNNVHDANRCIALDICMNRNVVDLAQNMRSFPVYTPVKFNSRENPGLGSARILFGRFLASLALRSCRTLLRPRRLLLLLSIARFQQPP